MFNDSRGICLDKSHGFFDGSDWNFKFRSECGGGFIACPHTQYSIHDASTAALETPLVVFELDKLVGLGLLKSSHSHPFFFNL